MNAISISELPCSSWAKNHAANNRVRSRGTCGASQQPPPRAASVPTAASVGIGVREGGILVPGMSRTAAASGNSVACFSLPKHLPLWPGLTQRTMFWCPSRLSFPGLAGDMEVSEQPRGLHSPPWAQTRGSPAAPASRAEALPRRMKRKRLASNLTT